MIVGIIGTTIGIIAGIIVGITVGIIGIAIIIILLHALLSLLSLLSLLCLLSLTKGGGRQAAALLVQVRSQRVNRPVGQPAGAASSGDHVGPGSADARQLPPKPKTTSGHGQDVCTAAQHSGPTQLQPEHQRPCHRSTASDSSLPPGWQACVDHTGRTYCCDTVVDYATWATADTAARYQAHQTVARGAWSTCFSLSLSYILEAMPRTHVV